MSNQPVERPPRLVHPVYLDVPMLISFLAALEGGVRFEDHITVREKDTTGKEKDANVRVGLPLSVVPLTPGEVHRSSASESTCWRSMPKVICM